MACINPNSPEFKAALERNGGNPLLAEIELDKGIKPGVEELFSSNPELANQVYEALGFSDDFQYIDYLKSELEDLTGKAWNKFEEVQLSNDAEEIVSPYDSKIRELKDAIKKEEQKTNYKKQQALQQYSQYLDTIFPDSEVKDIVYHVNKTGTVSPQDGRAFYSTSLGSWLIELEEMKGNRNPVLINITNPTEISSEYEFTDKAQKFRESGLGDEYVTPDEVRKKGTDSVIGRDSGQGFSEKTYVTYNSNQVYQLGSKQDIERFKEFVGKEEVELSPEEMYQKSLDLSDKEIEERINKCRS
jgi:hypothetical protein